VGRLKEVGLTGRDARGLAREAVVLTLPPFTPLTNAADPVA
jgi:hypothetical protein